MKIDHSLKRRLRLLAGNPQLVEAGKRIVEEGEFQFNGFQAIKIDLLSDWTANPFSSRSWQWNTASFNFMPALLAYHQVSGDELAVDFAISAVKSWAAAAPGLTQADYEFAKHDHATALRADNTLMLMAYLVINRLHVDSRSEIRRLILKEAAMLEQEEFYSKHTNHGIEQSRVLALVAHCFPKSPRAEERLSVAAMRLVDELEFAFTSEGVHVENSPAYHLMVCNVFLRVVASLPEETAAILSPKLDKIIPSAMVFLCHMARPDGFLPIIGDTQAVRPGNMFRRYADLQEYKWLEYSLSQGRSGEPPRKSAIAFPKSGYLVARDRWRSSHSFSASFHLIMKCGWHSGYHRHDDDLNIVLYYGEDWLIDGGGYSYNEEDPLRRYLRSKWAHNVPVVETVDDPWGFKSAKRHKAVLEVDKPIGATVRAHAHTEAYPGYQASREIEIFRAKRSFTVRDRIESKKEAKSETRFHSLWHVPADKQILVREQELLLLSKASGRALHITNAGKDFDSVKLLNPCEGIRASPVVSWRTNQLEPCQLISLERQGVSFSTDLHFEFKESADTTGWQQITREILNVAI